MRTGAARQGDPHTGAFEQAARWRLERGGRPPLDFVVGLVDGAALTQKHGKIGVRTRGFVEPKLAARACQQVHRAVGVVVGNRGACAPPAGDWREPRVELRRLGVRPLSAIGPAAAQPQIAEREHPA